MAAHGLSRVRDLLYFFPRGYEDYRSLLSVPDLVGLPVGSTVVVRGRVSHVRKFFRRLLDVTIEDAGSSLRARWFRPHSGMAKAYSRGQDVALAGRLRRTATGEPELIHPSNVSAALADGQGLEIRPRYPLIDKVPGRTVEKIVHAALTLLAPGLADPLPEKMRARLDLPDLVTALEAVHRPARTIASTALAALVAGRSPAQRRFAFEDLLVLQLSLLLERGRASGQTSLVCAQAIPGTREALARALPFSLTSAQENAVARILAAMGAGSVMQCLLQGDVGSGKTAVAFAASLCVARAGGQTLFMTPTAVLAEQHLRTLAPWADRIGLRMGLLHSGLSAPEQRQTLEAAEAGRLDVIVGTHALLEERLRLRCLGLAVVDEQHRFGVRQRARLRRIEAAPGTNDWQIRAQDGIFPHLLVLSATPIPRSLALTLYGDLDLVTLDALPPGRRPVLTHVGVGDEGRAVAYAEVRAAVARGEQAFVVCPSIDEDEGAEPRSPSTTSLARELRERLAPGRVGVLHGKLSADQQRSIVRAFRQGSLDVLVATTVLEVGVDVPHATVMVIEGAHRFGLAQLHQLRGRVGRGELASTCHVLVPGDDIEADAISRLRFLASTQDGFLIAEEDLRRRGTGDLQGTRQSGSPELRFSDLSLYTDLLELARVEAKQLLARDPALDLPEHRGLRHAVLARTSQARPVAEEAG